LLTNEYSKQHSPKLTVKSAVIDVLPVNCHPVNGISVSVKFKGIPS
jgi:hypothetical protein